MKITITEPQRNIVLEWEKEEGEEAQLVLNSLCQTERVTVLGENMNVLFSREEPKVEFAPGAVFYKVEKKERGKVLKPVKAANFLKDNPNSIIAAFKEQEAGKPEICILTKNYAGTGRYVFLSLTEHCHRGTSYMPEAEALDLVINNMVKMGFVIKGFERITEFFTECKEYFY